jgi:hypothetical protein
MSPENAEILKRVEDLEALLGACEEELLSLEGKLRVRAASDTPALKRRTLLGACFSESILAVNEGEAFHQSEAWRLSAVEYFKNNNVDVELWKNIVF